MNRFRKAWLALAGKLEPEVREVPFEVQTVVIGDAKPCPLYAVGGAACTDGYNIRWVQRKWYATCEQAHSENPGEKVSRVEVWKIGETYIESPKAVGITLQPKPKREKGKRAK